MADSQYDSLDARDGNRHHESAMELGCLGRLAQISIPQPAEGRHGGRRSGLQPLHAQKLGSRRLLSNAEDRSAGPALWLFTSLLPAKALSKHTHADLPALQKSSKICAIALPIHTIAHTMQCSARAAFRIVWGLYALSHIEKPPLILRDLLLVARPVRLAHLGLAIIR